MPSSSRVRYRLLRSRNRWSYTRRTSCSTLASGSAVKGLSCGRCTYGGQGHGRGSATFGTGKTAHVPPDPPVAVTSAFHDPIAESGRWGKPVPIGRVAARGTPQEEPREEPREEQGAPAAVRAPETYGASFFVVHSQRTRCRVLLQAGAGVRRFACSLSGVGRPMDLAVSGEGFPCHWAWGAVAGGGVWCMVSRASPAERPGRPNTKAWNGHAGRVRHTTPAERSGRTRTGSRRSQYHRRIPGGVERAVSIPLPRSTIAHTPAARGGGHLAYVRDLGSPDRQEAACKR